MTTRIFSLLALLFAGALLAKECYMLQGRAGAYTPVPPQYIRGTPEYYMAKERSGIEDFIEFPTDMVYFGCQKSLESLMAQRRQYDFVLKEEQVVRRTPRLDDLHLIVPDPSGLREPGDLDALLERYTPKNYLGRFPKRVFGEGIEFLPIDDIPFMPRYNIYELARFYQKHRLDKRVLVLSRGVYTLEYLHKKLADPTAIRKVGPKVYELNVPLYITHTASLVVKDATLRLQSAPKPVVILYNGGLYLKNATITTWDMQNRRYHPRQKIPKEEVLLVGKQRPRPYLLGFSGSKSYFIGSRFKGLGFHSTAATFGVAFADLHKPPAALYNLFHASRERFRSEVVLLGNDFSDMMMGFFSNNVDGVVLVGNYYHDNVIYDVDPHDYGKNFIIARNVTASAQLAHGIVLSREMNSSLIAQNVCCKNNSVGIMLDRAAGYNIIYDNLLFENGVSGITIQESDHALVQNNHILYNAGDGVLVRNSLATEIIANTIGYNLKNGTEIFTKDIDDTIYRDFLRDPYHKATAAIVRNNDFFQNLYSEILTKNSAAVRLENNSYDSIAVKQFDGDLRFFPEPFTDDKFTLYGMGYPLTPLSSDKFRVRGSLLATLEQIYCDSQNPDAITFLGEVLLQEGQRTEARKILLEQSALADPKALYALGLTYFGADDSRYVELLVTSAVLGYSVALFDVSYLPYFLPYSDEQIQQIYERVRQRLLRGDLGVDVELGKKERKKVISRSQYVATLLRLHDLDFYDYAKRYTKVNKKILTPALARKVESDFAQKNDVKIRYFEQLMLEELKVALKDRHYYRKKFVSEALEQAWREKRPEAMERIIPLLRRYLEKINRHRLEPLSVETILGKDE